MDWRQRRRAAWVAAGVLLAGVGLSAAELRPAAAREYDAYRAAVRARRAGERADAERFLAMDFTRDGGAWRRRVLAGEVVVAPVPATESGAGSTDLDGAEVHHWRGAILLPGATLDRVLADVSSGMPMTRQEDVLASAVLGRSPGSMKVFLRLRRQKVVTVVLDTEHDVTMARHTADRASSTSTATRIAEVESPGSPRERDRPPGDDRGFLWRLDAWWRYEQVPEGVIAECESISLSRDVPSIVHFVARPIIDGIARESMEKSLRALQPSSLPLLTSNFSLVSNFSLLASHF